MVEVLRTQPGHFPHWRLCWVDPANQHWQPWTRLQRRQIGCMLRKYTSVTAMLLGHALQSTPAVQVKVLQQQSADAWFGCHMALRAVLGRQPVFCVHTQLPIGKQHTPAQCLLSTPQAAPTRNAEHLCSIRNHHSSLLSCWNVPVTTAHIRSWGALAGRCTKQLMLCCMCCPYAQVQAQRDC